MVSFDTSEVGTPNGACSFAFEISISCRIFRFLRLGVSGAELLEFPQLPPTSKGVFGSCSAVLKNFLLSGTLINFQCKTDRKISWI
jgi:hypothetical protein